MGGDAYIVAHQSRSILCVPLIKKGTLAGLLYMEHSLTPGIFTVDRVQMLEVLASQAAISLENARLYEDLEAENLMRAAAESHLRETQEKRFFQSSSGCAAGSSAGASPAKRTLDARRANRLVQGWLRQNAAISPARQCEQ
jgi:transcriptional regulator with GAF, ATPase, and Fis domain